MIHIFIDGDKDRPFAYRRMSYNVADDDPTYNPFAEDERFRSLTPAGRYSSAFFPSSTLRRRQSPSLNEQGFLHEGHPKRHTRAHTEIQIVSPNSAGLHPLKSALAAATFDAVLPETVIHVTRPNLSRIVGGANTLDVPSDKDRKLTKKPPDMADQERDVIVHQVWTHLYSRTPTVLTILVGLSGNIEGFSCWCCRKVWYHTRQPPKSKPALDIRLHSSTLCALYPN